ncbi:MAG: tyrosine-type recombinase/integrase [Beijerinckiaceae bacterium]|nr:tyrosine-type recombinase/integrase [Beijerinckiaceae bacterium]
MLTDTAIKSAKPSATVVKLSDSGGLQLWVTPQGGKYRRMAYRVSGKQRVLAIGVYPATSLKAARSARDKAREALAVGHDPSQKKRLDRIAAEAISVNTFSALADEFLAKKAKEGKAETTIGKLRWMLDFAKPDLGPCPVASITPPQILAVLRKVERRGRLETATRLRSVIGQVFRYAIATGRAEYDPTPSLRGALTAPITKPRAAIVQPIPFGALLRTIESYDGTPEVVAALQLLALTFVRPGELRHAEWSEFDLEATIWTIPASRMKMRRPHRVPLAPQALGVLKRLQAITGSRKLLFPSVRSPDRCMSENTVNAALRRLGYGKDDMTGHGFRSAASSMLNETGIWNPDAIEAQLTHVENNSVRRAYARADFWDERVKMMVWWADRLDAMRRGGEVVALRA